MSDMMINLHMPTTTASSSDKCDKGQTAAESTLDTMIKRMHHTTNVAGNHRDHPSKSECAIDHPHPNPHQPPQPPPQLQQLHSVSPPPEKERSLAHHASSSSSLHPSIHHHTNAAAPTIHSSHPNASPRQLSQLTTSFRKVFRKSNKNFELGAHDVRPRLHHTFDRHTRNYHGAFLDIAFCILYKIEERSVCVCVW